ncbi:MAG: DNA adenine methylase [Planctomycetota bacterium]
MRSILPALIARNTKALRRRFAKELKAEERYLQTGKLSDARRGNEELPFVGSSDSLERERRRLVRKPATFPFRLATITFPGAFFGMAQCIEIDSIRFAISEARKQRSFSASEERWLLVALGSVMARVNNSTGQFAQYLKLSSSNLPRVIQKRRRSVVAEFLEEIPGLTTVGTRAWRQQNRAFRQDTCVLLPRLRRHEQVPAVVYADPPYSKAQYSRYYHVLDTIVRYDYPEANGVGRYPSEDARFRTPFSLARHVEGTMRRLVSQVADMGSTLVLSYPRNGLFATVGGSITALLEEYFGDVQVHLATATNHSTFGGSHATRTVPVEERLYLAQP